MALDAGILQRLTQGTAADAWSFIIERTLDIASRPLAEGNAPGEVVKRDREIGELDLFLASSGWDLWRCFGQSEISGVERTSDRLARWWAEPSYGNSAARAVLVLDALSLRELPWLLQGAKERGFTLQGVTATASELPGETNEFARALGLSSRSQLQANGGGLAHKLQPAQTETIDLPWKDCEGLVGSASGAKNWVFWHHWPDAKLHDYGAGQGLELLTKDAAQQLSSDDFWPLLSASPLGGAWSLPRITATPPRVTSPMPMVRLSPTSSKRSQAGVARLVTVTLAPLCLPLRCKLTVRTVRTCWRWAAESGAVRAVTRH